MCPATKRTLRLWGRLRERRRRCYAGVAVVVAAAATVGFAAATVGFAAATVSFAALAFGCVVASVAVTALAALLLLLLLLQLHLLCFISSFRLLVQRRTRTRLCSASPIASNFDCSAVAHLRVGVNTRSIASKSCENNNNKTILWSVHCPVVCATNWNTNKNQFTRLDKHRCAARRAAWSPAYTYHILPSHSQNIKHFIDILFYAFI